MKRRRKGQCYPLSIHVEKKTNCDHKMNIEHRTEHYSQPAKPFQPSQHYFIILHEWFLFLSFLDQMIAISINLCTTPLHNLMFILSGFSGMVCMLFVPSKQDNMARRRGKKDITNKFIHLEDWIKFAFRNSLSSF